MRVFANLAVSLDGKIADLSDPKRLLGTSFDRQNMEVLRRQCDAIIVGANTLRAHSDPMRLRKKTHKHPANVLLSGSGKVLSDARFWEHIDVMRFVFTTELGFKAAQAATNDRAFVIAAGKSHINPVAVLMRLKASGYKSVLVEGGGEVVATFLEAKLLQELYVTLTPWCIGGRENPTLVGGAQALLPWTALKLQSSKRRKDELYLHYKIKGAVRV